MMKMAYGMVPKATVVWSVAEPLAGVNKVGVGEVVQLGDALPAVGSEDAAERFATFDDMHAATRGCGSADSGWCAPVGDDVARIDQVDVAGWCAPYGQWSQAGSLGDAGHGVVVAHGHAHASVGSNRRVCRGFVEPLGDDAHDQFVVRPQSLLAVFSVAAVAADHRGGQCLQVGLATACWERTP